MPDKLWNEITYPPPNFNGAARIQRQKFKYKYK